MCSHDLAASHASSVTKQRIKALLERNIYICTSRRDRSVEEDEIGVGATKRMKRMN
jgi:hypothetical protein